MITFLTIIIGLIGLLLMAVVLIQNPKGGGLDSTFGAGGNQMLGAAKSTDFIEKLTWGLAAALFILCIVTAIAVSGSTDAATEGTNLLLTE